MATVLALTCEGQCGGCVKNEGLEMFLLSTHGQPFIPGIPPHLTRTKKARTDGCVLTWLCSMCAAEIQFSADLAEIPMRSAGVRLEPWPGEPEALKLMVWGVEDV
jgi:hypothetical protein